MGLWCQNDYSRAPSTHHLTRVTLGEGRQSSLSVPGLSCMQAFPGIHYGGRCTHGVSHWIHDPTRRINSGMGRREGWKTHGDSNESRYLGEAWDINRWSLQWEERQRASDPEGKMSRYLRGWRAWGICSLCTSAYTVDNTNIEPPAEGDIPPTFLL